MLKYLRFVILFLFSVGNLQAQQYNRDAKKYIFLLDITKSMFGCCGSPDIFDEVRTHLISAIENIPDPNSEIVLSTYQQQIINTYEVQANAQGKNNLIKDLNKISSKNVPGQETNIYGAWQEAKRHLDKNKINIVFILTDGEHNDPHVPITKFYEEIPKWEKISTEKQAYMFIVELTELAVDNKLRKIVRDTKDVQIINGIEFFILEIAEKSPIVNTEEDLSIVLGLKKDNWNSNYDNLPLSLDLKNEHFTLEKDKFKFSELPIKIKLVPKKSLKSIKEELPPTSSITLKVHYPSEEYPQIKILDNIINIQINNRKEKVLRLEVVE